MEHWYWFVRCKTSGCSLRQLLHYVGSATEWIDHPPLQVPVPQPLRSRCSQCGAVHEYALTDLIADKLPFAPPRGFENVF